jgi:hypothetical protein
MSILLTIPNRACARTVRRIALLAGLALWIGCAGSSDAPPTHPVTGRIHFEHGDVRQLWDRQGAIQFQSVDQPDVYAFGEIHEDGAFTLTTLKGTEGWPGAIPGKHVGRLNLDEQLQKLVAPKFLDYKKSGIEITVPTSGEVVIKISAR